MSPRSESQWEEIRKQSREKILTAALELFAAQGYHNTSIEKIAQRAGVAKGLVYNYFPSKENLFEAVVENGLKETEVILQEVIHNDDPKIQLRKLIEFSFKYIGEHFEHFKLVLSISMQLEQFPQLIELVRKGYEQNIPFLADLLQKVGVANPREESRLLIAMMDGIGLQYTVMQKGIPLEEIKSYLLQKYEL